MIKPGQDAPGAPGLIPIDVEPNEGDVLQDVKIIGNVINATESVLTGGGTKVLHGIAIQHNVVDLPPSEQELQNANFGPVLVENNTIVGMTLSDGVRFSQISGAGILFNSAQNVHVRGNHLMRCYDGIKDLGGSSNLNLLVTDGPDGPDATGVTQSTHCYVVRVYRPWVTAARLADMQLVRRQLANGAVPCVLPIRTLDGESWVTVDSRLVEVEPYVEHDAKMDSWERLEAGDMQVDLAPTDLRAVVSDAVTSVQESAVVEIGDGVQRCVERPELLQRSVEQLARAKLARLDQLGDGERIVGREQIVQL